VKIKKKRNWSKYIIELLVVFVGITAGFLLNSWREDALEQKQEINYLLSFQTDISNDKVDLDSLIFRFQKRVDTLTRILRVTEIIDQPLTEDLAITIVNEMLYLEWLSSSNDTYNDMINSGNLNLISDFKLKEKITSYYQFTEEVKNVEQYYKNHINDYCFPFIYKNFHLLRNEFVNKESYKSLEFTNMYLGVIALLQQNLSTYSEGLEKNIELQTALDNHLIDKK